MYTKIGMHRNPLTKFVFRSENGQFSICDYDSNAFTLER